MTDHSKPSPPRDYASFSSSEKAQYADFLKDQYARFFSTDIGAQFVGVLNQHCLNSPGLAALDDSSSRLPFRNSRTRIGEISRELAVQFYDHPDGLFPEHLRTTTPVALPALNLCRLAGSAIEDHIALDQQPTHIVPPPATPPPENPSVPPHSPRTSAPRRR